MAHKLFGALLALLVSVSPAQAYDIVTGGKKKAAKAARSFNDRHVRDFDLEELQAEYRVGHSRLVIFSFLAAICESQIRWKQRYRRPVRRSGSLDPIRRAACHAEVSTLH